jgi:hypothetical protein
MRRLLLLLLTLVLLLLAAPLLNAQDELPVVVELTDGYTINVPDGWESREGLNDGFIISDGASFLYVMDPTVIAEKVDTEDAPLLADILIQLFELQYRAQLTPDQLTPVVIGELEAISYSYDVGAAFRGTFLVVELSEATYALFDLTESTESALEPVEFLSPIIASMLAGDDSIIVAATVVPCMVTAAQPNTVSLRVGPGDNRAVLFYMPADVEVRANGLYLDAEGDTWLRLIKSQIAPDSASDEIWVAEAEVVTTGDCTALIEIASRDIIPAAPPVVALTEATPEAGAAPVGGGDPNAVVGVIPRGGVWTFAFDTTALQSCANGDTTRADTVAILGDFGRGFSGGLNVAADGRSFTHYGTTYYLDASGEYIGNQSFGTGVGQTTRLRLVSDSQMSGSYTINVVGADYQCSITIFVSMRRG